MTFSAPVQVTALLLSLRRYAGLESYGASPIWSRPLGARGNASLVELFVFVGGGATVGGLIGVVGTLPSGFATWIGLLGLVAGAVSSALAYGVVALVVSSGRTWSRTLHLTIAAFAGGGAIAAVTSALVATLNASDQWLVVSGAFALSTGVTAAVLTARESVLGQEKPPR